MPNIDNLCMGCMREKKGEVCEACGYQDIEEEEISNNIPPRSILANRYVIGEVLGIGGFGTTYIALDLTTNKKVAIKEYMPRNLVYRIPGEKEVEVKSSHSKETYYYGLEKYIQEAGILSRFQGIESIVQIYDCFEENNTAYLVMEFLDGVTLIDYVKHHNGKIAVSLMLEIINPILNALEHVHKAGLVHRDISPDNIFITQEGHIKLLDFGAARYSLGQKSNNLSVILKPGYAPPEQYFTKGKQGPWTDIYAIAATMYRCVSGQMPVDSMQRMEQDSLVKPSQMDIDIDPNVENAILKALELQYTQRYHTAKSFLEALFITENEKTIEQVEEKEIEHFEPKDVNEDKESQETDVKGKSPLPYYLSWLGMIGLTVFILMMNLSPYFLLFNFIFIIFIVRTKSKNKLISQHENNQHANLHQLTPINQQENDKAKYSESMEPYLIGITGQFKDIRISIDNQFLTLGRDAAASNLVFSKEECDISRKHCAVKYDRERKKFILIDYSSLGTFLSSGARLIQGKEYSFDNDVMFYLVSRTNTFRLLLEKGEAS